MIRNLGRLYADAFRGLPAVVWRLSAGLLINRAGTMVLPFLSLYLVRELGYETSAAGLVLLAFGLGSMVGSYLGGAISGRVGTVRVQIASLALAGVGFLLLVQLRSVAAMALGVFAVGAISDAFRPACLASVVEAAPAALRTRALGLVRLAANAGMAIGPAAGGLLAEIDYRFIFVGEAATCWLAGLWLWRSLRGHEIQQPEVRAAAGQARGPSVWTDGPFIALLLLIFPTVLVLFQVFSTLPLYLTSEYALSERQVGLVFALNATLIVAFEMVVIKLLERRDPALVLGFGMFLMCAGFGLLPFGRGMAYAALTVVVWTVGEMLALPFSNALVAQRAGAGRAGEAMGLYTAMFSVAVVVAPPLGLWVLERFGGDVLWVACGLVGIPAWVLTAVLARTLRRPPARGAQ